MFKKVTEDAILPTKGTKYSACVDVYANEDVTIGAGETKLVGLGIAINFNKTLKLIIVGDICKKYNDRYLNFEQAFDIFLSSHYLQLMLRSSLAVKGLMLGNGVGVIDLDYKDEIKMIIHNPVGKKVIYVSMDGWGNEYEREGNERQPYKIKKGNKIGQLILLEHKSSLFGIESEEERNGGFGSTGK